MESEVCVLWVHKTFATVYSHCMWTLVKIIAFVAICYGAIVIWMYLSQRKMLYIPSRTIVDIPTEFRMEYEDVWLTNELGTKIHAWWLPHEKARFTVLFSHGNGGNISHRMETLHVFRELGLSVLIYDYSGYGQSDGEPSEVATMADTRAAWDWLVTDKQLDPQSIILFGRSLGGAVSALLAADLAGSGVLPAGIVLESTFTSVPDMGAYIYPWLPVRQLARYQYDSLAALAAVRVPALFAHSQDDDVVPFELGRRLHDTYKGPKSFFELTGDHNHGYFLMGQEYSDGLNRFLTGLEQGADS